MTEDPITYHSEIAREYAHEHPLEEKDESFFALLETFIEMVGGGRVLDAGCGPGHETQYFHDQGLDAVGVDAAEGMIEYAQQHHDGTYHQMDLRDLDLEAASFDGIWCNVTMQFFPAEEMETVLDAFDRILKPEGVLYITFKLGNGSKMTEDHGKTVERYLVPENRARKMLTGRDYTIVRADRAELKWGLTVLNIFAVKE